jgi:hypothetical protein
MISSEELLIDELSEECGFEEAMAQIDLIDLIESAYSRQD